MKAVYSPAVSVLKGGISCLLSFSGLIACTNVFAQTSYPVTAVSTSASSSGISTTYSNIPAASGTISSGLSYTYNFTYGKATQTTNNNVQLNSFVANGQTFTFAGIHPTVTFRRVNINTASPANLVTGKRVTLWLERPSANTVTTGSGSGAGGTAQLIPDYTDALETLFAGRIWNVGIDNVFQNAVTTNNNNIERMDVVFPAGVQATNVNEVGFSIFDRGADGGNDPFLIAAIKTVDGSGNPTSYYTPVAISKTDYGSGLTPSTALTYHILRKEATDAQLEIMTPNQAAQNRNGVLLTFSQLGIPVSTTTYGYSIFAPDVTYTTAADLLDYTNSAHFPNNSDLSGGGIDMVAITGVAYTSSSSFLVILPVQIVYFNAVRTGATVQLDWKLDQTDNLKEAVLERSGNGRDFAPLSGFYSGFGMQQTYEDKTPLPGQNDYRLQLVNNDGTAAGYSQIDVLTMDAAGLVAMDIYPNPVQNKQFTVDTWGLKNNETYHLRLFDMNEKLIFRQDVVGAPALKKNIALSGEIPAGVYTVELTDMGANRVVVKTILIE